MLCKSDKDVIYMESRRGFFSLESDEGFEKYLHHLNKEVKRFGINASFVSTTLKILVKRMHRKRNK